MIANFLKNSIWLTIGKFGTTLISFALVPLYTRHMTPTEFGIADLVLITTVLLIPVITCQVGDAIQTFLLKKEEDEKIIYSNSIFIFLAVWCLSWLFYPLFQLLLGEFWWYLYVLLFFQSFNNLNFFLFKGLNSLKPITFISIIESLTLLTMMFVSLSILDLKMYGFLWSLILSKIIALILSFKILPFREFFQIDLIRTKNIKTILFFSFPLVPNMIGWWINNSADRYMINYFLGFEANGIYAIGAKIPSIFYVISGILISSWQITSLENYNLKRSKLFKTAGSLFSYLFLIISLSIILLKDLIFQYFISSSSYNDAVAVVIILLFAAIFSSMSSVFGVVYLGEGKTKYASLTTIIGGGINILLNFILIPRMGVMGAAWATLASFLVVFILRAKYVFSLTEMRVPIPFLFLSMMGILLYIFIQYCYIEQYWFYRGYISLLLIGTFFAAKILINDSEILFKWIRKKY